ncbi:MAG: Ribonuclease G [Candidatus Anoxychlamydiales bacterium]|nr:Ribonuclease G [Candidatus Anoxychlamydiales bacterium]NGX40984.1 Ribonuclease G [Candidatus Anoxychlamydiales bacterium]
MKEILINVESKEIRYAYLSFGQLNDLIIDRKKSRQITGNIYRGQVKNILNNIQSAFIDIHESENGFIHINDIIINRKKFEEMFDMDFDVSLKGKKEKPFKEDITKLLKINQPVLVQVVKESIGTKGARLTSNISIAGRYLVLLPNTPHRGVSRKIENRAMRDKLKKLIQAFEMPKDMGLICRTASANATTEMLIDEATKLLNQWQEIVNNFHEAKGPKILHEEWTLLKKAILTAVDKKYNKIIVDNYSLMQKCLNIYKNYEKEHKLDIVFYKQKLPLFEKYNVEREIDKSLRRKVWLPSGGYLYFDKTEAMYTIDVNSGRSSKETIKNVEETLVRINLEAAKEIGRQLRLRNVGGLVICDFIDMRLRKNQRRVLEKLKESMKEDSSKCTILGMSEFGLVEMTRQRARESLIQTIFTPCPYCAGNGLIKNHETTALEIERSLKKLINNAEKTNIRLVTHPYLDNYLKTSDKEYFIKLASNAKCYLEFKTKDSYHLNEFHLFTNGKKADV